MQDSTAFSASLAVAPHRRTVLQSSTSGDDFSSFAASLETPTPSPRTRNNNNNKPRTWKDDLDELLDPATEMNRRQALFTDVVSANQDIREAVETALRDRKIDPLLTPTGKKLQDGTRAVARQLSTDILPSLAANARNPPTQLFSVRPQDLQKNGNRFLNAVTNQMQQNLQTLQRDLLDPSRIPSRISQQTSEFVQEAANVLRETPVGLKEPPYTLVATTNEYEIRDYAGYKVVSTNMAPAGEVYRDSMAQSGQAFNTLASYIFGANRDSKVMEMTTPVTTTMSGEMRFYLAQNDETPDQRIPEPLAQDESKSVYETGNILIQDIPPARLAVRRFPGFATAGEQARQKEILLAALSLDDVELDVPHGQTVGHVLFQYNPPYTVPVLRRNEIAVPVVNPDAVDNDAENNSGESWASAAYDASSWDDGAPSD